MPVSTHTLYAQTFAASGSVNQCGWHCRVGRNFWWGFFPWWLAQSWLSWAAVSTGSESRHGRDAMFKSWSQTWYRDLGKPWSTASIESDPFCLKDWSPEGCRASHLEESGLPHIYLFTYLSHRVTKWQLDFAHCLQGIRGTPCSQRERAESPT